MVPYEQGGRDGRIGLQLLILDIFLVDEPVTIEQFRFINKDGKKFVEQFQPEISRKTLPILQNYISR